MRKMSCWWLRGCFDDEKVVLDESCVEKVVVAESWVDKKWLLKVLSKKRLSCAACAMKWIEKEVERKKNVWNVQFEVEKIEWSGDFELFCCFPVSKKVRRSEKTHFWKSWWVRKQVASGWARARRVRCSVKVTIWELIKSWLKRLRMMWEEVNKW